MRFLVPLSLAAVTLTVGAASPALTASSKSEPAAGRVALSRELAGLRATETTECLNPARLKTASVSAYGSALVYRVDKNLMYVNETSGGCEAINRGDQLGYRSNGLKFCRGVRAETTTYQTFVRSGQCTLGSFTTWRK